MRLKWMMKNAFAICNILVLQGCLVDTQFTGEAAPIKSGYVSSEALSENTGPQIAYIPMYYDSNTSNHYPYLESVRKHLSNAKVVYIPMTMNPATGTQTPVDPNVKIMPVPSTAVAASTTSNYPGYNTIIYTPQTLNSLAPAAGVPTYRTANANASASGW